MRVLIQYGLSTKVREIETPSDITEVIENNFNLMQNTFFLQIFDEDFGEYIDLEDTNLIQNKSH